MIESIIFLQGREMLTSMAYKEEMTNIIPANNRVEIVSTNTAESRFLLRSSYVIFAEEQYASPVIAAKFMVNLLTKSKADSRKSAQHFNMRLTHPPSPRFCFAASRTVRTNLTAPITIPEKETVPKEGPKAFLKKEK